MPTDPKDKRKTSAVGLTIPENISSQIAKPVIWGEDEITANHSGAELRELRAKRPTHERFERIEDKLDEDRLDIKTLTAHVSTIGADVGEVKGQLKVLPDLVKMIQKSAELTAEREHVTFTSQVQVDTAGRVATIADTADAKKTRRHLAAKIIGAIVAAMTSGAAIHWLLSKL